ncbi:MAG TPA: hypothetical protein VN282_14845 [Pyrinomonadaceae bacterium]|nr:hypothetical protein [Pyrinomonadaceae bacterium]
MLTSRDFKALLLLAASLLLFHTHARAQSGRRPPTPVPAPAPTPIDYTRHEKVRVVVSGGVENFVKALNEQGRLGYRMEKTVSYGSLDRERKYAAVLELDPGHTYDYDYEPLPEDARYEDRLNYYARRGYALAHAYAVTECRLVDVTPYPDDLNSPSKKEEIRPVYRGNVLLFMRRGADATQTKEYRVFKGLFALDGGQKKELQAELDAAPRGFRPVRLLFAGSGPHHFRLAVVAERDLGGAAPPRAEYQLVKEVFGFEEKVNRLAAAGARYVGGGRMEFVKIALMERRDGGAHAYAFKDDSGEQKDFEKAAAGGSYAGLLVGDLTCTSDESLFLQKLVFARDAGGGGPAREYRVLGLSNRGRDKKVRPLSDASVSELRRLNAEGFRVRDIFYSFGLHLILERQAEARDPQVETSER